MIRPEPSELQELVQPGPGEEEPLQVSTARLDRLMEHCVGDFTVTVQAGMPLQQLQAELARHQQWLAVDWPWGSGPAGEAGGSVGGLVARGLAGGLRQRYLGVRDQLIGLSLLRADQLVANTGALVGWTDWLAHCIGLAWVATTAGELLATTVIPSTGLDPASITLVGRALALGTLAGFTGIQLLGVRAGGTSQEILSLAWAVALLGLVLL